MYPTITVRCSADRERTPPKRILRAGSTSGPTPATPINRKAVIQAASASYKEAKAGGQKILSASSVGWIDVALEEDGLDALTPAERREIQRHEPIKTRGARR